MMYECVAAVVLDFKGAGSASKPWLQQSDLLARRLLREAVHVLCCLFVVVVGRAHLKLGQNANAHSRARLRIIAKSPSHVRRIENTEASIYYLALTAWTICTRVGDCSYSNTTWTTKSTL
jgi:hypothetical protein